MTSAYDFIESAIKSLEKARDNVASVAAIVGEESTVFENELVLSNGHIDDAISELNEAKAMLY